MIGWGHSPTLLFRVRWQIRREEVEDELNNPDWEECNRLYGKEIVEKYKDPRVLKSDLAREYDYTEHAVSRTLEYHGVELKSRSHSMKEHGRRRSESGESRIYDLNESFFKTWTGDMAYILGFIYADGHIMKNKNALVIALHADDAPLLKRFKEVMGYTGEVYVGEKFCTTHQKIRHVCRLRVSSLELYEDLKSHGLTSNKSTTKTMPYIPKEYVIDFLRGYFDGNGCSEKRPASNNQNVINIRMRFTSGSLEFTESLNSVMCGLGFEEKTIHKDSKGSAYQFGYVGKEAKRLYDLFYKIEGSIYLERKKNVIDKALIERKQKEKEHDLKLRDDLGYGNKFTIKGEDI